VVGAGAVLAAVAIVARQSRSALPIPSAAPRELIVRSGDATLAATITFPASLGKKAPGVVLVHGSGRTTRADLVRQTQLLRRLGFAVLAYDKRGVGQSTGAYTGVGIRNGDSVFAILAQDARSALAALRAQPEVDSQRVGYFGASQAGWIIPLASVAEPHPRFMVIASGPAMPIGVENIYSQLTNDGNSAPTISDPAEIRRRVDAYAGPMGFDSRPSIARLEMPALWLLGDADPSVPQWVSIRALDSIKNAFHRPITVVVFPNADHDLRDTVSGEHRGVEEKITQWLRDQGIIP